MRLFSLTAVSGLALLVAGPRWAASAESPLGIPSLTARSPPLGIPSLTARSPTEAPPTAAARADDLPHFQAGLWEYRRTLTKPGPGNPQVSTFQKCSDPTAEIRQKMAELEKKGCQFLPAERNQQGYISQWSCPTPAGLMRFRDVLISQSDDRGRETRRVRRRRTPRDPQIETPEPSILPEAEPAAVTGDGRPSVTPAGDVLESKPP
jgi:hypothetical protein